MWLCEWDDWTHKISGGGDGFFLLSPPCCGVSQWWLLVLLVHSGVVVDERKQCVSVCVLNMLTATARTPPLPRQRHRPRHRHGTAIFLFFKKKWNTATASRCCVPAASAMPQEGDTAWAILMVDACANSYFMLKSILLGGFLLISSSGMQW